MISYSSTEKGHDGLCSFALYPSCVHLYFTCGAELSKSDPNKLLQGRGKTMRFVELSSVADLDRPEIEALMQTALKLARLRLGPKAKGSVVIRAEAQKERVRRAAKPTWPASKRKPTKPQG